jgi:hypothetical protein
MTDTTPLQSTLRGTIPAASAGSAYDQTIDTVPWAATVSNVTFTPEADITGAATNYRTYRVVNKGADGNGTTVVASLAFSSGAVTANDFLPKAITLSATAANLVVAAGDVLAWDETVAGSGLASPGGEVRVTLDRS